MKMLKAYKGNELLVEEVENANHFVRRFMGLMYRKSMAENHGLLLTPCDEIHTFGMRFAIDTVALDRDNRVLLLTLQFLRTRLEKRLKCKENPRTECGYS